MTIALVNPPARAATIQEITSPSGIKAWLVEDYTVPDRGHERRLPRRRGAGSGGQAPASPT